QPGRASGGRWVGGRAAAPPGYRPAWRHGSYTTTTGRSQARGRLPRERGRPLLRPLLHWRTGAEQIAVAIDIVDAVDHRPVFVGGHPGQGKYRLFPGVAALPVAGEVGHDVRRLAQRVVLTVPLPLFDPGDLFADGQHGVDETVQLRLRLALGGLHHQGAGDREGHGGRMEAEVHQAFGDVLFGDAGGRLEWAYVENALVGNPAIAPAVEHGIGLAQPPGNVVGIENGHLRGPTQTTTTHECDIGPADRQ